MEKAKKNVKIVVLGDINHSPRMINHATSIAAKGHFIDIIGYGETNVSDTLRTAPNIYYHYLTPCPQIGFKILNYIWKTIWSTINLLFLLFITRRSDIVLVQNPPAIPTLYASWIYCKIIGAELVIDWHNYAHTIMALNVGNDSPLVQITRNIEVAIGKRADYNFCVSNAMKNDLYQNWQIRTEVLYDRPSDLFFPLSCEEKHDFLIKLCKNKEYEIFADPSNSNSTIFTNSSGGIQLRVDRPAFMVTSTSWTEDENFSILIQALQEYEDHIQNGNEKKLPNIILGITGKGPLKEYYCNDIKSRKWQNIKIITPWLQADEYPLFIACADIGISLHTSSSGLDLPMKIVDMFGCCLPVFAYNFKALDELLINGETGCTFNTYQELFKLFEDWFENFPINKITKRKFKSISNNLMEQRQNTWNSTWEQIASPIFT